MRKKMYRSTLCLLIVSINTFGQQWTGSATTTGDISRDGNIGIGTGNVSFGQQGNHLMIGRPTFTNQLILGTGWNGTSGDYTDLRVPGALQNNAVLRLQ